MLKVLKWVGLTVIIVALILAGAFILSVTLIVQHGGA
jgi:hypothetical protein